MAEAYMRETMEIVPRNLVYVYRKGWNDDRKFPFDPTSEAIGDQLTRPPYEVERRLVASQVRNRQYHEAEAAGNPPYEKHFRWPRKLLDADLRTELLDGYMGLLMSDPDIRAYKQVKAWPRKAIKDLRLNGPELSGDVMSKKFRGGDEGYYAVTIDSPFLDRYGNPDLRKVTCQCKSQSHDRAEKGGDNLMFPFCTHASALLRYFYEWALYHGDQKYSESRNPVMINDASLWDRQMKRGIFMPFSFASHWTFSDGEFYADDPNLASLEDDMRVAFFSDKSEGSRYFRINGKAYTIHEINSPMLLRWMGQGLIRREVNSHGNRQMKIGETELKAQTDVFNRLCGVIKDKGFRHNGYFRQMGRVAWCYEDKDTILGLIPDPMSGVFYAIWDKSRAGKIDPTGYDGQEGLPNDPYTSFGWKGWHSRFCDLTMRPTQVDIGVPTAIRLKKGGEPVARILVPEIVREKIRRNLTEANRTKTQATLGTRLEYAGLMK
jgi:hypothetical protein